jgi:hypothetical protein
MNASRIAELGTNTVGRLRHRMPMQSHRVDVLHEYIQRPIIGVPCVLHLNRKRHWRHVEEVLESRWHLKVRAELRVVVIEVDRRRRLCYDAIIRSLSQNLIVNSYIIIQIDTFKVSYLNRYSSNCSIVNWSNSRLQRRTF